MELGVCLRLIPDAPGPRSGKVCAQAERGEPGDDAGQPQAHSHRTPRRLTDGHHRAGAHGAAGTERSAGGDAGTGPQRTLLSWAEFLATEPVRTRRRSRKPKLASPSVLEWAMEQGREKDPACAGR